MRSNNSEKAVCCECGSTSSKSLGMFDVCIGGKVITICDVCNNDLLRKTLKASCLIDGRLKNKHDIEIIRKRKMKAK